MKKHTIATISREQAVLSALGSVRAEDLEPSLLTHQHLLDYSAGTIDATQLRERVISDVKASVAQPTPM